MGGTNSKRIKKAALGKTRVLKFRRKRLTPADLQALCQALSCETNRLVSMEFNAAGIGLKGLAKIAEAIQHPNCRLTRLCIFNEHVGAVGARILAKLITLPKKPLMSLILENNVLTSEGATILAEALQDPNNRLHVLYLLNNHIGPEGIVAICNALRHENNRVVELSLTGNYLGVEGLAEIGAALKHPNNKIEYLRLGRNRIDNRGACILAKAMIHENARVRSLDLENNSVSDTRDLTRAMKLSKLQWVDLSFNNDNPYDQTRMYCDIRVVFFEKRRYWMSILALCSARGAPSVLKKFYEDCAQLQIEEEARKQNDAGFIRRATHSPVALAVRDATRIRPAIKKTNICYLCLLPKDLIKMIAEMVYPWPRTEKMLIGFVY